MQDIVYFIINGKMRMRKGNNVLIIIRQQVNRVTETFFFLAWHPGQFCPALATSMAAVVAVLTHLLRSTLKYLFPNSRLSFLVDRSPYGLPLPAIRHQVLTEEELGGRNLLVVGDVHGCYDELVELLERCNGRDPNLCVVFVGDLMNKGPKSAEVVRLVREMEAYCVRGNHDEVSLVEWQRHCENGTPLPNKFQWLKKLSREDLRWAHELPYSITIPSRKVVVTHAGLLPGVELEEQRWDDLLHLRNVRYDADTQRWIGMRKSSEGSVPWASIWQGPQHVYFGHDARRLFQSCDYATGLDTGCVYGGKLTAIFPFEGGRIVQVESHEVYEVPKGMRNTETEGQQKQGSR